MDVVKLEVKELWADDQIPLVSSEDLQTMTNIISVIEKSFD